MLYSIRKNLNMVKENLKNNFFIMSICSYENHMVFNPGKCHYLVLGKRSNSDTMNLNGTKLASGGYEKLLGIFIDRDLHTIKNVFFLIQSLNLNSVIVH